jgi:hypothetical protein
MKTKTYHANNLGSFAPPGIADDQGYIRYHVSARYSCATDEQLSAWTHSRIMAVRNAAITEQCERRLAEWQRNG